MTYTKADYARMLTEGCSETSDLSGPLSRLEYLGEYIFDFTTYDGEMAELFARYALEVCAAISNNETFEYIKDEEQYRWYLLMVNMPFFADKITWGTSIRGAWWDGPINFSTCGLWLDGDQVIDISFNLDQWREFIEAILEFAAEDAEVAAAMNDDYPPMPRNTDSQAT